jgi:hypothetical protein
MTEATGSAVCVFGSADPRVGDEDYEAARSVGRELARLGYVVVNGGYGGVMEASSRGAQEAGGRTVGVTCSVWSRDPNPYLDEVIATGGIPERVGALLRTGTGGYVVMRGGTGTLVELSNAWELMAKGVMARRPIVCYGEFWRPLVDMMASGRETHRGGVALVRTAEELGRHFPPAPNV